MRDLIHTLRQKPEHMRHRVAVGGAVGMTALIALVWITTKVSTGAFALGTGEVLPASAFEGTESFQSGVSALVGAVGAFTGATSSEPRLRILDGSSASTLDEPDAPSPSATVIPF